MEDNDITTSSPCTCSKQATPKMLVLCFDGTGDQFDSDNSNVVKFFSLLKRDNPLEQMVYYQAVSKTLDKMVAWNLEAHVINAAGDKICLFGFSRGAYTASALAGMLHKVGLLPPWNHQQVPFAYKIYKDAGYLKSEQCKEFKDHFSIHVGIDFMGVWDTVSSVGLIPRWLPMTASNATIRVFRHALSLDERRAKFEAHRYHHLTEEERRKDVTWDYMLGPTRTTAPDCTVENTGKRLAHCLRDLAKRLTTGIKKTAVPIPTDRDITIESINTQTENVKKKLDEIEKRLDKILEMMQMQMENLELSEADKDEFKRLLNLVNSRLKHKTSIKEVWFAGCHSDVGGGSVANTVAHSLARIPLRWMILEVFRTETGIQFRTELFKEIGLKFDSASPGSQAELKVDEDEERKDAMCQIYDQLNIRPWWWALEVVPVKRRESKRWWGHSVNLGHGRIVWPLVRGGTRFYIHRTVRLREEAIELAGGRYKPKATWEGLHPEYVE